VFSSSKDEKNVHLSQSTMKPVEKDERVLAKLDAIEAEMKKIGFWSDNPPEFEVSNFTEAPTFELWLQCIFLPNARAAATKSKYPAKSQVGLMAMRQYNYHSFVDQAQTLLALLHEFDRLIESK
jgi:uncharacterized protein YqcC (DUF446 family)